MKFRKKPVVIEAIQWKGDNFDEYAPMSYRGMYMGKKPFGDSMENPFVRYADGGHYWMYTQLKLLSEALGNER